MGKKANTANAASLLGRVAIAIAIIFLFVYILTVLSGSFLFFERAAKQNALTVLEDDLQKTELAAEVHFENLYQIADKIQYAASKEQVADVLVKYIGSEAFGMLRFCAQGVSYTVEGAPMEQETGGEALIAPLRVSQKRGCTGIYYDSYYGYDCIAFYIPIRGSAFVDGLMSIIPARNIISLEKSLSEKASVAILADKNGKVLTAKIADGFDYSVGNDLYDFVGKFTTDKTEINMLDELVRSGKTSACILNTPSGQLVAAMSPVKTFDSKYIFMTLSLRDGLIGDESDYIGHVITLIVIASAVIVIGIAYAVSYARKMRAAVDTASFVDPVVGCANLEQFKEKARVQLQNRQKQFAVCIFELRQFRALNETNNPGEVTELLKYIAKVLETVCRPREAYGYMGKGSFVQLICYENRHVIRERVRLIETMTERHTVFHNDKSKRKFDVGICLTETAKRNIDELLEGAAIACNNAKNNVNAPFEIYTKEINDERVHNDQIEAEMEAALQNGDFKLFLQPKYNVAKDCVDSAEALVRWFDPKTGDYRFPAEFIGLFETNGFIKRLDHYMYLEALKTLSTAAQKGEKVVPISVNVSMLTVNDPDFLSFYISNKQNYRIGDGFIIIEFTESFAIGDYHRIYEIITTLHKNGIRCSLDDFGTGYASLGALKNLPIDELKLDRLFLQTGIDGGNDEKLLETMITLGKSLGIKVVQEGVETKEMFDNVVKKGCDAIQGYYYAKAIPAEEYRLFINSNTSIKYKSLVK